MLHGSGRKQPILCVAILNHSVLSNCSAPQPLLLMEGKRQQEHVRGHCVSLHTSKAFCQKSEVDKPSLLHVLPLYPKLLFATVRWLSSLNVLT